MYRYQLRPRHLIWNEESGPLGLTSKQASKQVGKQKAPSGHLQTSPSAPIVIPPLPPPPFLFSAPLLPVLSASLAAAIEPLGQPLCPTLAFIADESSSSTLPFSSRGVLGRAFVEMAFLSALRLALALALALELCDLPMVGEEASICLCRAVVSLASKCWCKGLPRVEEGELGDSPRRDLKRGQVPPLLPLPLPLPLPLRWLGVLPESFLPPGKLVTLVAAAVAAAAAAAAASSRCREERR